MRNSICRVRERKIALCGLPIYWKKEIGSHDLESDDRENAQHDPQPSAAVEIIRSAAAPSAASTKEHRHLPGKELSQQESVVVTQTAHTTVCRRTFNTRSYRRAP